MSFKNKKRNRFAGYARNLLENISYARENECMQRDCMQYCVYFTKMGRYMHCVYERVRRNATKNRKVKKESA